MKTSRLSLAAIAALGITTASLSASNLIDIKLPDEQWKFVGVNGGFTESSGDDINTTVYNQSASETVDDNLSTAVYSDGSDDVVTFRVIDHSSATEFSSAKMYVSSDGHSYDGSYTQPEMYVYIDDGNTTPDIRIKYQGDYEGETFYLELNGSSYVYSGTFDSAATYDNAQALGEYSVYGSNSKDENLTIEYVFDRNITDNPGQPGVSGVKNDYKYSSYNTALGSSDTLRIYHYNAVTNSWETYISAAGTVISEDFSELEKGKGYWVKYDMETSDLDEAGLILGDTGIETSDYSASNLAEGWNMMSFNDSSLIATGGTGVVVELNTSVADTADTNFTIADSGETESIAISVLGSDFNRTDATVTTNIVQRINKQIAQAKAYGTLSKNFNVVAYNTDGTRKFILASDKKFRIKETDGAGSIDTITTLAGNTVYVPSLGTKTNATTSDINTTYVESVYGEYTLALRIPTDDATFTTDSLLASQGDINVSIGDDNDSAPHSGGAASVSALGTALSGLHTTLTNVNLDTDFNGHADTILLVNDTYNFSVQDSLFVKTYLVNETVGEASTLAIRDINGTTHYTVSLAAADNLADEVDAKISAAGTLFDVNRTSGYIYVDTNDSDYRNFYIEQISGDVNRLELVTDSTEYNASGTVREVYSLENLSKASVDYYTKAEFTIKHFTAVLATNDFLEFNITNPAGGKAILRMQNNYTADTESVYEYNLSTSSPFVGLDYNITSNNPELNVTFDSSESNSTTATQAATKFAAAINYYFGNIRTDFEITATSSGSTFTLYGDFNLTNEMNESNNKDINITGSASLLESNLTISDTLTDDLKYNRVYAGSVTTDSEDPVPYLQKLTGYKVRKMLTTNEEADTGASISWNFVDLTKDPDEWFNEEDAYNLFSFDKEKGYWVYLEDVTDTSFDGFTDGTDSANLEVVTTYNHSFINDTNDSDSSDNYTTTNFLSSATVQVDVSEIADTSVIDRAVAKFNGEYYTLSKSGNLYTTTIEEILDLDSSDSLDLNATLFTADSFSTTVSTSIDNSAPTRPVASLATAGDLTAVTLTSSTDTVYFHTYSGDVDMAGTNLVDANLTATNGVIEYNLCSAAETFGTNVGAYRFIAVDNVNMSYGLISNIGYLDSTDYNATIYPIYKNGSILSVSGDETDSLSMDYNSSCETSGVAETTDHAVELRGVAGYDVAVAFEANTTNFADVGPSSLATVDLLVDDTKVAQLVFDKTHYVNSGQIFLMQYNGNIYSTDFAELITVDGSSAYFTDNNITMLTGQTISE